MGKVTAFIMAKNVNSLTGKLLILLSYIWFVGFIYVACCKETLFASAVTVLMGITVFVLLRALTLILESVVNMLYYVSGTQKEVLNYMGHTQNSLNEIRRSLEEGGEFFKRVEGKLDLDVKDSENDNA